MSFSSGRTPGSPPIGSVTPTNNTPSGGSHDTSPEEPAVPSRETLALLRSIVANSPVVVWALDQRGDFLLSEGKGLKALGLEPGEVVGQSVFEVYRGIPEVKSYTERALRGESTHGLIESSGITFETWHSPIRDAHGRVVGVAGMAFDVTQRERTKEELLDERELLQQMLRFHERDRKLIAFDIHDGLVQTATAASLQLEAILARADVPQGECREQLESTLETVRKVVADARRLIRGLRPPELEEHGLIAAIKTLIDNLPADGPTIEFHSNLEHQRLGPLVESTVFRIVQEGITNTMRHSQAERAAIDLREGEGTVELEIRDWGIGFDPESVGGDRFGIQGIRERARLIRGRATVESSPGHGTRIAVTLPHAFPNQ